MMKKLICILSIAIGGNIFGQTKYSTTSDDFNNYHSTVCAAERMYKNDSLLQAYAKYDIAFENYKGSINASHYFKAALCAIKIKEEFKALYYLEKSITNGYEVDSNKLDLIVFNNQNTNNEYHANIDKWTSLRDAGRNSNWENELYASKEEGKKYSSSTYKTAIESCINCLKNKACSKTAPEYLSKYKLVKEKIKADSIVAVKLLNNIQQFGFPNMKLVDKKACAIARNILLNYDADKKNERLDNVLFKALNDGYISPAFYAQVVDRRNLMNAIMPEFYEPLTGYEKTIGSNLIEANNKRKTIGLYPITISKSKVIAKTVSKDKKETPVSTIDTSLYDY